MKINRLIEIIIILLNKETVTAKELSERFNVSQRTIYRDIEELSSSGIPVYMSKGRYGGISLLDNYTLDKTILSEDEKGNIIFALKTLEATKQLKIDNTLDKIGSIFGKINSVDWVQVDFTPWGSDGDVDRRFDEIKSSILKQKILKFKYVNSQNIKSQRTVKPYKIIFKGQAWYLLAYCCDKEAGRIFKITRMRDVGSIDSHFERKEISKFFNKDKDDYKVTMIKLKLKFNSNMLYRIIDYYDEEQISKNLDGTYLVIVEFPYDEWVYSHILSYGDDVEVIEPAFIREEVKSRIKSMMGKYII
ncbi:helix-turn-helix transcriptional regulator [Clostridium lundense]|uniref:helix-turn-helix transcriptional regulator n=1 Tax=Clostridium lundense TaxID=319475 RepID=UPI0004877E02|nr:YafY family protein [Clostridium lundense]